VITGAAYAARHGRTHAVLCDLDLHGAGLNRSRLVNRLGQLGRSALGFAYGIPECC
jgi:hypothetical protein